MRRVTFTALERQLMLQAHQVTAQRPIYRLQTCDSILLRDYDKLPSNQVVTTSKAFYSQNAPDKRPSFLGSILSNLKQEYEKNKDMQESLKKFRDEAKKLEESDALKEARRKFETIESETTKSTSAIKGQLADKVKGTFEELGKHEAMKKAGEFTRKKAESFGKVAGETAENLGKSQVFKSATEAASTLKEEIEGQRLGAQVYRPPSTLRMRKQILETDGEDKPIEINTDATGVELHKDSKFYASWQSFKDSNPVYNKFVDYRVKYEESDNAMVRGARMFTDRIQDLFGGIFGPTELSGVLTEIVKMDPNFCKEQFLKDCERDIIPNILEAFIRGELEVLQDWCFEAPYSILSTPIRQAKELGYMFESRILDIDDVDLAMGKMTEQGPVLAITFTTQMIECLKDLKGNVVQGDPDKVMRVQYIWVLCRVQSELDPKAAWRLMELAISSANEQFL